MSGSPAPVMSGLLDELDPAGRTAFGIAPLGTFRPAGSRRADPSNEPQARVETVGQRHALLMRAERVGLHICHQRPISSEAFARAAAWPKAKPSSVTASLVIAAAMTAPSLPAHGR